MRAIDGSGPALASTKVHAAPDSAAGWVQYVDASLETATWADIANENSSENV